MTGPLTNLLFERKENDGTLMKYDAFQLDEQIYLIEIHREEIYLWYKRYH